MTHPYPVGENVFIRTVTLHYTGRLVEVYEHELVLVDAAWIAETARYADTISMGALREVEPYPDGMRVIVGRGALVDCVPWNHELPRKQL